MVPAAAPEGVPEVVTWSSGSAVTSTQAAAVAAVARSALSSSETSVSSDPNGASAEMSTVALTSGRAAPATMVARVEVQVSRALPPLREQLHPVTDGAAANVSPTGRVAMRTGSS